MKLSAGIVGLPNVGKSTLFNTLTNLQVEAANYPFATIEPNVGIVKVNDKRLFDLASLINPEKTTCASCTFVDIAGLVKGASNGEGLGNKFLSNIREVNVIVHVIRCFENNDITHYYNTIDPIRDLQIINTELILADLEQLTTKVAKIHMKAKSGDKDAIFEENIINKLIEVLKNEKFINKNNYDEKELEIINKYNLLTSKTVIYVCNIEEKYINDLENCLLYKNVKNILDNNQIIIPISINTEYEISKLPDAEKKEYMNFLNIKESSLDVLINTTYHTLNLKTFFTFGKDEVKAWTFTDGMNAAQCAGTIHSDIERGFIRAEICDWKDLIEYKTELKVKENGKYRLEGKEYLMNDGDVVYFRFNVSK